MSYTTEDFKIAKNFIAKVESNIKDFTIAAGVGAAAGVLLTAMNEKSNAVTIGVSALAGLCYTVGINTTPQIGLYEPDAGNLAIVAGVGFAYTGFVGAIGNRFLGTEKDEKEFDV